MPIVERILRQARSAFGHGATVAVICATLAGCVTTYDGRNAKPLPPGDGWLLLHDLREPVANPYSRQQALAPGFAIAGYTGPDRTGNGLYDCPYPLTPQPTATSSPAGENVTMNCRDNKRLTLSWAGSMTDGGPTASAIGFAKKLRAMSVALVDNLNDADFAASAAQYRSHTEQPGLPENVREFKIGAENAVREKRPADAIIQYRKGLLAYPTWPQARFNLALLYGELGIPDAAITEMQRYLLLVPDAANARQAQDKIYEWKAKP